MQIFILSLFTIMITNIRGTEGTFYMFPTEPYVLELMTPNEEVKLSKTHGHGVEIAHKDPYTQQWSEPKLLSTEQYSKHKNVDLNQHNYTHNNHTADNNWNTWQPNMQAPLVQNENISAYSAPLVNEYQPNMSNSQPLSFGVQQNYTEEMIDQAYPSNPLDTQGMTFNSTGAVVAAGAGSGAAAMVAADKQASKDNKENSGSGAALNEKDSKDKKSKSKSDKKSSASDSKKNTSSKNKMKKNSAGGLIAGSCVINTAIACLLLSAM